MSNLNVVALQGNLVDDPKIMGEENNVARFTIAINNGFGDKETTTFVDCVAFGKQVTTIAAHFKKGKQIIVNGQLTQNRWEDKKTGEKRSKLEVRLNTFDGFSFVSGGNGRAEESGQEEKMTKAGSKGSKPRTADSDDGKLF